MYTQRQKQLFELQNHKREVIEFIDFNVLYVGDQACDGVHKSYVFLRVVSYVIMSYVIYHGACHVVCHVISHVISHAVCHVVCHVISHVICHVMPYVILYVMIHVIHHLMWTD